jgi:hypothetical protein
LYNSLYRCMACIINQQVSLLSTAGRAKAIILFITLFGFGLSSYPLWTVGIQAKSSKGSNQDQAAAADWTRRRCLVYNATRIAYKHWSTAILRVGTLALPGAIIAIVTSIIIVKLIRAARRRTEHMEGQV